jgi:outer membrane protein assembly factor BamA
MMPSSIANGSRYGDLRGKVLRGATAVLVLAAAGTAVAVPPLYAQASSGPTGWEPTGLPILKFDSDEGVAYGAVFELYNYGDGGYSPYRFTVQPAALLTMRGRREFEIFFDAPHVLPEGWRMDARVLIERQFAFPYYGLGNSSVFDPLLETTEDKSYYRFGRTQRLAAVSVQRRLGNSPIRLLAGVGVTHTRVEPLPEDATSTLLDQVITTAGSSGSIPETITRGWSNHVRAGAVWDTRDRETGPHRGTWSEVLVQAVPEWLGSESAYVRWTAVDRRYVPLGERLTLANRLIVQDVEGRAPFYDLYDIQTSFKQREGLGGGRTLRGIPRNRYVGKGLFLWNAELRWRAVDFDMIGRSFHMVFSTFVDTGRVWADGLVPRELFSDLHTAYGFGIRGGMGENFIAALDIGRSSQSSASIYMNIGYIF